ncbi:hypothetical protein J6590_047830 [Homalodisca vitripennis]|nr:hypothetical protein J6590_047830 [Homalodisca vitripennis]
MPWRETDWLTTRVDKWVAQCQGYTKLRSRKLSRGCQTMLDRPSPFWSRGNPELLADLTTNITPPPPVEDANGNREEGSTENLNEKRLQYDEDIANYIAYLNKPVINMNDHYIEIHQWHYEPSNFQDQEVPIRPPTRRKKHRIDLKKTEIVDCSGISSVKSPEYSEFLVKRGTEKPIKIVSGRSSDEENKEPEQVLDRHRALSQPAVVDRRVDTVVSKEGHVKIKRGETFSASTSSSRQLPLPTSDRSFLSFRTTKKNKSGRRKKKVVVGEEGIDGPIWPAVLLTFDRSISPGPPETPDESQV